MSILVVEALSEGLIFGADRNITTRNPDGTTAQEQQWPKVLKWPSKNSLFGYVGEAQLGRLPMHEWLGKRQTKYRKKASIEQIARGLAKEIQSQRSKDECKSAAGGLVVHIGGFERRNHHWVPVVWYISNIHKPGRFGYLNITKEFLASEEFWSYFKDVDPSEIRKVLKVRAKQSDPFWFHQGVDLFTFNVLQDSIKSSFRLLCQRHPDHDIPTTLEEWTKHVRMQVLMYGAYFQAFFPPGRHFVGGGVDIQCLPWPEDAR
jgi:hypothetical protein